MPTSNLALVSQSLQHLLTANIARLGGAANVTLGYPEDRAGAQSTINLHLYHVAEDQFNRNTPGPGTDANNVATAPMSLSLFYLLTAHDNVEESKAITEQKIMGYALKTLHDFAMIDADTQVIDQNGNPSPVLQDGVDDGSTTLEIILRPLTPEDALAYWASERQQPVRLSAYYEVRLVQLMPERPETFTYPVLTIGEWVGPKADPLLAASRSAMRFAKPPSMTASLPDTIELSPARVFLDLPPIDASFPDTNRFWLLGTGLGSGIRRRIVISNPLWRTQGVPAGGIRLEEAIQPAPPTAVWGVQFHEDRVDVQLSPTIGYVDSNGAPQTLDVLPGTHHARVEIVLADATSGPSPHEVVRRSNEVLVQIAPRIRDIAPTGPLANRRLILRISPRFNLNTAELDVILIVNGESYTRITGPVSSLIDKTMKVGPDRVTFQVPFPINVPGLYPVRLSVNGVDAQPSWLETP
jgi:hypothetical protein